MKDAKFYVLLVLWVLLATVPGLYVTLFSHGHIDANTDLNKALGGAAFGLWIGGWLAQFGIFFWLMAICRKQNFIWWFVSAGVTWAVDWVTPVNTINLILWPAVIVATAVWIAFAQEEYESLEDHGISAKGVVLQVNQPLMNVIINGAYIKRKLRLRIERSDDAAPYEATYDGLFMFGDIPSVGDAIPLLVDPGNPKHFQYDDKNANG